MSYEASGCVKDENGTSVFQRVGVLPGKQLEAMFRKKKNKKKNGWAKVFHFDWLGSMQMEDNERKLFCTSAVRKVGQHFIWAPQPYGASQYVLCNCFAPVLFFNLSNYLACPSWWGGVYCCTTCHIITPLTIAWNTWHHLERSQKHHYLNLIYTVTERIGFLACTEKRVSDFSMCKLNKWIHSCKKFRKTCIQYHIVFVVW